MIRVETGRIEQRDDGDRRQVVDDDRGREKNAQLDGYPAAQHGDDRDRERGVGRGGNGPSALVRAGRWSDWPQLRRP